MDRRSSYQSLPFLTIERISLQLDFNSVVDQASVRVCAQLNRVCLVWSLPAKKFDEQVVELEGNARAFLLCTVKIVDLIVLNCNAC